MSDMDARIACSHEAKEYAEQSKRDDETWDDWLRRVSEDAPDPAQTATIETVRQAIRDVING
jgi:hypothetical protein